MYLSFIEYVFFLIDFDLSSLLFITSIVLSYISDRVKTKGLLSERIKRIQKSPISREEAAGVSAAASGRSSTEVTGEVVYPN